MNQDRREFLRTTTMLAGASLTGGMTTLNAVSAYTPRRKSARMKLRFRPYTLQLKHVFTIATSSRTTTPVMLTEVEYDGVIGYGEASMPPYLG